MSEERKAKAAARRAARKEKSFNAIEAKPLIDKPAELPEMTKFGGELEAAKSIGENKSGVTPITSNAVVGNPNGIIPVKPSNNKYNYNVNPIVGKAEVMNPKGIIPVEPSPNNDLRNVPSITGKAEVMNPAGLAQPSVETPKPLTIEDMLAAQRKRLEQDKTDAAKMQKYYAFGDVLKALGQMGGAAVGGAIGGNTLDSAPAVEKYKESRGYLDAFERAKQANDRLRALDEKEFNLNYSKQLRDDERAYNEKQKELDRKWNAEQNRIKMEWQAAVADKDFERQAALKKELAEAERKFKFEYQKIANEHDTKIKNISKEIVNIQNGIAKNPVPIGFKNGKGITVPKAYYEDMQDYFIGEDWNGRKVTKDNVKAFIKNNPEAVNAYLEMYGMGFIDKAKPTVGSQSKDSKNWFDPMMVSYNRHAEPEQTSTNGQQSANAKTKDGQSTVVSDEEFVKKWGNNSI